MVLLILVTHFNGCVIASFTHMHTHTQHASFSPHTSPTPPLYSGNNDLQDLDVQPSYPASSNHSNVVTVASLDEFNQLAYYSNYGKGTVELAAPGSNIMSTIPTGIYLLVVLFFFRF